MPLMMTIKGFNLKKNSTSKPLQRLEALFIAPFDKVLKQSALTN